jgi:uncharacterized membrane protein
MAEGMNSKPTGYYYTGALLAALIFPFFYFYLAFTIAGGDDATAEKIITNEISLVFFLLLILVLPVVATRYFRQKNDLETLEYFSLSFLRYALAYLMFFYGTGKLFNRFFDITYSAQDTKLAELKSFYLTWYFFGRSTVQIVLLGLMELIPAILLLFRRTYFLGAVILLPVSANVFIVNTFNRVSPFTFLVSLVILLGNMYLIWSRKAEIQAFFKRIAETGTRQSLSPLAGKARIAGKVLVIGSLAYFTGTTIYGKVRQKISPTYKHINKITGGFELQQLEVNNRLVLPKLGDKYYQHLYLEPQARWNSVKTFDPSAEPAKLVVKWNAKNDSVSTYLKLYDDVARNEVDSATTFVGTYKLVKDKLLVNGVQNGDTIKSVYLKKKLTDYTWFW